MSDNAPFCDCARPQSSPPRLGKHHANSSAPVACDEHLQDLKAGAMFQLRRFRARPSMPALPDIWSVVNDEVTNLFTAPPNLTESESRIGIEKQLPGEI
jgi:hypothetical protein